MHTCMCTDAWVSAFGTAALCHMCKLFSAVHHLLAMRTPRPVPPRVCLRLGWAAGVACDMLQVAAAPHAAQHAVCRLLCLRGWVAGGPHAALPAGAAGLEVLVWLCMHMLFACSGGCPQVLHLCCVVWCANVRRQRCAFQRLLVRCVPPCSELSRWQHTQHTCSKAVVPCLVGCFEAWS